MKRYTEVVAGRAVVHAVYLSWYDCTECDLMPDHIKDIDAKCYENIAAAKCPETACTWCNIEISGRKPRPATRHARRRVTCVNCLSTLASGKETP